MPVVLKVTPGPHSGQEYQIDRPDTFTVGRSSHAQFAMTQDLVLSRKHFQVENKPPLCHLIDLGSTNGTKVNGLRVTHVALREGDVITAGDSAFIVHFMEDSKDAQDFAGCAGCGGRIPIGSRASRDRRTRSFCPTAKRERLALRRVPGPPAQVPQDGPRLPDRGMDRRRRHGRGLSRPPAFAEPPGRHQDDEHQQRDRREGQQLFPPRDRGPARPADARRPLPSQHRQLLRDLRGRLPVPARHGVCRRQERPRLGHGARTARCRSPARARSAGTCSRRSTTPIRRATSIAT